MGKITHSRFEQLVEMGREPINLPYEIYFNGNETLQKAKGSHHLEQYRSEGTYNHPSVKAQRKREALDYAKRLLNGKMSSVTLRKIGGIGGIKTRLEEFGLTIDQEQMEVINMNADFLSAEYEARKTVSEEERKASGRVEAVQEPEAPNKDDVLAKAAEKAAEAKLSPANDLSSGDEEEKRKKVQAMSFQELGKELKARGVTQKVGMKTGDKQELLLKNL